MTLTKSTTRQPAGLRALSSRQNYPLQLSPIYRAGRGPLGNYGGETTPRLRYAQTPTVPYPSPNQQPGEPQ